MSAEFQVLSKSSINNSEFFLLKTQDSEFGT